MGIGWEYLDRYARPSTAGLQHLVHQEGADLSCRRQPIGHMRWAGLVAGSSQDLDHALRALRWRPGMDGDQGCAVQVSQDQDQGTGGRVWLHADERTPKSRRRAGLAVAGEGAQHDRPGG